MEEWQYKKRHLITEPEKRTTGMNQPYKIPVYGLLRMLDRDYFTLLLF